MPASNIFSAIQEGMQFADDQQRKKFLRQQEFMQLNEQRKGALFQDARVINSFLKSDQPQQAMGVINNRLSLLDGQGDPSDTLEIANLVASGNYQPAMDLLDSVELAGVRGGFLKDLEPSEMSEIALEKARIELDKLKGPAKINPEFLKEERQVAKQSVVSFNKRASEIRSSFGKIESILGSGKLNRMKIASAMTSMARLLSPGIVTNQDFQSLSNSSNPVATLMSTLTGKGDDGKGVAENLQRFIDPTNPDLFDKESFLATAKNVAGAEIPSLIDTFNDSRERAGRAGISERALKTNFDKNKNFDFLTKMVESNAPILNHPKLGNVTESQIQETMKNKNMTREQILAILQGGD